MKGTQFFTLILIAAITILISGCKSTPKNCLPFCKHSSDGNGDFSYLNKNKENPEEELKEQLTFIEDNSKISPELQQLSSSFQTIDLKLYLLNEHKLHHISLRNKVLFQYDKANLELIDSEDLKAVASLYNQAALGNYLYLIGHTDSQGSQAYNQSLSIRRAIVVAHQLVNLKVPADKIKIVPAGEVQPISTNSTSSGRSLNRRVEILTSDSHALITSYFRQIDCSNVDKACVRTILPILDVNQNNSRTIAKLNNKVTVATLSPELNQLTLLNKTLVDGAEVADKRIGFSNDDKRWSQLLPDIRKPFSQKTEIRPLFSLPTEIRPKLILPKKYEFKARSI